MEPNFEPAASRAQDIFLFLQNKGYDVYFPANKVGECTAPYIVVKTETTSQFQTYSSTQTFYGILCYIPRGQYSTLEPFVDGVKEAMKGLWPMIAPTHIVTEPYLDEHADAYMVSIGYVNYRKM